MRYEFMCTRSNRARGDGLAGGMPDSPTDAAFHEETTDPLVADARNFYEVEKWTPAAHPRERTRVLDQYPPRP
jgi:hypothetical protein